MYFFSVNRPQLDLHGQDPCDVLCLNVFVLRCVCRFVCMCYVQQVVSTTMEGAKKIQVSVRVWPLHRAQISQIWLRDIRKLHALLLRVDRWVQGSLTHGRRFAHSNFFIVDACVCLYMLIVEQNCLRTHGTSWVILRAEISRRRSKMFMQWLRPLETLGVCTCHTCHTNTFFSMHRVYMSIHKWHLFWWRTMITAMLIGGKYV